MIALFGGMMDQLSYWFLILRYPSLRNYINECYLKELDNDLFDFLMGLETGG
jgi:hypothetical protein